MKIINLVENNSGDNGCLFEHGLSFYLETDKHKILMDTGASDAIIANAKILNIELNRVDTVVLSHGHYDHSGGILPFVSLNDRAKIYLQEKAGEDYYSITNGISKYIGIDKRILKLPQLVKVKDLLIIDDELVIFSKIANKKYWPNANRRLKKIENGQLVQDNFEHEQCLVVKENNKSYLFSGCGHNGIINILTRYQNLFNQLPDVVISGFHMVKKDGYLDEDIQMIQDIAYKLAILPTVFYTGHCTGRFAFDIMKSIMKDQLHQLYSGMKI